MTFDPNKPAYLENGSPARKLEVKLSGWDMGGAMTDLHTIKTAPKDGTQIIGLWLCRYPDDTSFWDGGVIQWEGGSVVSGFWAFAGLSVCPVEEPPTHWMSLPGLSGHRSGSTIPDDIAPEVMVPAPEQVNSEMTEWQPIEDAPVNQQVDIWVIPPSKALAYTPYRNKHNSSGRIPDAVRNKMLGAWTVNGQHVTGRWFFDEDGDTCLDIDDHSEYAFRATHFMPPPDPPE